MYASTASSFWLCIPFQFKTSKDQVSHGMILLLNSDNSIITVYRCVYSVSGEGLASDLPMLSHQPDLVFWINHSVCNNRAGRVSSMHLSCEWHTVQKQPNTGWWKILGRRLYNKALQNKAA